MIVFWIMISILTIVTFAGLGILFGILIRHVWGFPVLYTITFGIVGFVYMHKISLSVWIVLLLGWLSALFSVWVLRLLRKRGYIGFVIRE